MPDHPAGKDLLNSESQLLSLGEFKPNTSHKYFNSYVNWLFSSHQVSKEGKTALLSQG